MNSGLRDLLQQHGQRNTQPRQAVFAVLKAQSPMTIQELRQGVSADVDTASTYRTLNLFRELDIAQDVVINGRRMIELTERFTPHHHHLACVLCGKTVTLHEEVLEKYLANLATKHGFKHKSHSFEISGICGKCQQVAN